MDDALVLTGAMALGPEGLSRRDLALEGGRLVAAAEGAARRIDLAGMWLLPGIVDLHGDGFERHLAPRRGVVGDLAHALPAVETDLAAAGVTTAWLAQFWSWEGGMRGPDFARRLAAALAARRPDLRLDLRLQLRFERTMLDDREAALAFVAEAGIDYVVFNDHVPHARLAKGIPPPRLAGSAGKAGRSPEAHLRIMQALAARAADVPETVAAMARVLAERGVTLGAHDDADAAERATWGALRLRVAEFPVSREAAAAARARGEPVVMGAPNVVRGGSHNRGGVSAEALVAEGLVDALASDYHYPSLAEAAFALERRGVLDLRSAWHLVSAGPAAIMGLTDRGRLDVGLRADLLVYDPARRRIEGVLAEGRPVLMRGAFADAVLRATGR